MTLPYVLHNEEDVRLPVKAADSGINNPISRLCSTHRPSTIFERRYFLHIGTYTFVYTGGKNGSAEPASFDIFLNFTLDNKVTRMSQALTGQKQYLNVTHITI